MAVTISQIADPAMDAMTCKDPLRIMITYPVAKNVVHAASNRNKMILKRRNLACVVDMVELDSQRFVSSRNFSARWVAVFVVLAIKEQDE